MCIRDSDELAVKAAACLYGEEVALVPVATMAQVEAQTAPVTEGWIRDMSTAPRGETRKVKRGDREYDQHIPVRILAAGSSGVVTVSQWNPKTEAWSMFAKEAPPVAWMPWPRFGEPTE